MSEFLVSIITPTYNHARYIGECIESVLAQTYQNWEMLIVDDGSTDNTWEVIQQYADKDSRIRPFHQENKGILRLVETYNFALQKARGALIAILEGDDYWPTPKLEIQAALHKNNPNLVLSHGRVEIMKRGRKVGEYCYPSILGTASTTDYLRLAFLRQSCIMPVSAVVSKEGLLKIGGFFQDNNFRAVDYPTWLRLFQTSGEVIWIKDCLGYWRQSETQTTQLYAIELAEVTLKIALEHWQSLPNSLAKQIQLKKADIVSAHYTTTIAPAYVEKTRVALVTKNRRAALTYARKLIIHGTFKRKLQGLYSIAAAYLGLNMESILTLYERLVLRRQA